VQDLAQFRDDGGSVFLIQGELPECGEMKYSTHDDPQAIWWEQSRLLGLPHKHTLPSSLPINQAMMYVLLSN
jgi:hypothetical protein